MAQGPVALGVEAHVQIGVGLIQQLMGAETVEAQQPVGLIQAVLP